MSRIPFRLFQSEMRVKKHPFKRMKNMQEKETGCLLHMIRWPKRNLNLLRRSALKWQTTSTQDHPVSRTNDRSISYYPVNNPIRSPEGPLQTPGWQPYHLERVKAFQKWLSIQCLMLRTKWITVGPIDQTNHLQGDYIKFAHSLQLRNQAQAHGTNDPTGDLVLQALVVGRYPREVKKGLLHQVCIQIQGTLRNSLAFQVSFSWRSRPTTMSICSTMI